MKRNHPQASASKIETLVTIAQGDTNADVRQWAIESLWERCGDQIASVMLKYSYKVDSDHEFHDMTPERRREVIFDRAYEAFREWLQDFDPSLGVPFLAYTSQKSGWLMQDDKRKNSKRCKWVKVSDPEGKFCDESGEEKPLKREDENSFTGEVNSFERKVAEKEFVKVVHRTLRGQPKMLRLFDLMKKANDEGEACSDANMAEKLGCTRANVGVLRKKMLQFLCKKGLDEDFRLLLAA